jgi:hypothetical protein
MRASTHLPAPDMAVLPRRPQVFQSPDVIQGEAMVRVGPLSEYACHEGNYTMIDMLSDAPVQENKSPAK